MLTAGIFWSRNLCLSVIMLLRTKFRVNQKINRPDIAEIRFSLWRPFAMLNLKKNVALCHVTVLGSVTCGCTLNCAEIG